VVLRCSLRESAPASCGGIRRPELLWPSGGVWQYVLGRRARSSLSSNALVGVGDMEDACVHTYTHAAELTPWHIAYECAAHELGWARKGLTE
jgi:hypothetical protein